MKKEIDVTKLTKEIRHIMSMMEGDNFTYENLHYLIEEIIEGKYDAKEEKE